MADLKARVMASLALGQSLTVIEIREDLSRSGQVAETDVSMAVRVLLEQKKIEVNGVSKGRSRYRLKR